MAYLPLDITEKILLILPARLLSRLSLVCKQWRSLISDPKFVKDHANGVLSDQSFLHHKMILNPTATEYDSPPYSITSLSLYNGTLNSTGFKFRFQNRVFDDIMILSSCNGLLFIGIPLNLHSDIDLHVTYSFLCNPLFPEKYKLLPSPWYYNFCLSGFGHVSAIDDYKVVFYIPYSDPPIVRIYSLKSNSWKTLGDIAGTDIIPRLRSCRWGTHVLGSIYWNTRDTPYSRYVILALDLQTEKFKLIETPSDDDNVAHREPHDLVQIRGRLGVYWFGYKKITTVIWIWNEDENKKGYWTKYLTIPYNSIRITNISFLNNYVVLLHAWKGYLQEKLVIYNSTSMLFGNITCDKIDKAVHLVETLILPVCGDEDHLVI